MSTDHRTSREQLRSQIVTLKSTVAALERRLEEIEDAPPPANDRWRAAPEPTRAANEIELAIAAG